MASEKQIEANKNNAKKGGVKTVEGKEVSRMNALKHGILSSELYICSESAGMNHEEFAECEKYNTTTCNS